MKRAGPQRLTTSLNARFDVEAPKKALQNAEKQLDKVRLEAQKTFERERKQLTKKMDTLTPRGSNHAARRESGYMSRKVSTAVDPTPTALPSSDSAMSLNVFKKTDSQTGGITDFSCLLEGGSGPAVPMTGMAKQNEATRQLKFVNEAILQMIADAENTHRMQGAMSRPQASVPRSRDDASGSETETPKRRVSYALREAAGTLAAMGSAQGSVTDALAQQAHDEMPQHHQNCTSRDESGQESRRVSTGTSPRISVMSSRRQSTSSNVSMMNLAQEFQGPPSAAVQLVLLLTSGCAGKTLEPKEMKALTTLLDESRAALKAVKSVVNQIPSLAFRHPAS